MTDGLNMEELRDRALKYADAKAKKLLTPAISQAYIDGYNDGWNAKEEATMVSFEPEKVHFVDLDLPSGTLWAKNYLVNDKGEFLYLKYKEAVNLGIPSLEQWEELKSHCKWECLTPEKNDPDKLTGRYFICISFKGDYLIFPPMPEIHENIITSAEHDLSTTSWLRLNEEKGINSFNIHCDICPEKQEFKTPEEWQLPVRVVLTKR